MTNSPSTPDRDDLIASPYSVYEQLREHAPVQRVPGPDGKPAWLFTRYDDVRDALGDPQYAHDRQHAAPGGYHGIPVPNALDRHLLHIDAPDHTRIRRLASKAFTPRRIEQLRPRVERSAHRLLDAVADDGGADLITAYALPLPVTVICELLGVPEEDRKGFRGWADALIAPDPARPHLVAEAVAEIHAFLARLIADKRATPTDDLLCDLIAARDEGEALSEDELLSFAFLLFLAGFENTVHLIGNSVHNLLTHPEQLAALRADPGLLPQAVEELARHNGSVLFAIRRFPRQDVTLHGVTVPAGETVLLGIGAANRDPRRFPDPDRLDVTRDASAHLALGRGIHYCLGAPLARLETVTALGALLGRFPALRLAEPEDSLQWRPSIRARGLRALPVSW